MANAHKAPRRDRPNPLEPQRPRIQQPDDLVGSPPPTIFPLLRPTDLYRTNRDHSTTHEHRRPRNRHPYHLLLHVNEPRADQSFPEHRFTHRHHQTPTDRMDRYGRRFLSPIYQPDNLDQPSASPSPWLRSSWTSSTPTSQ